MPLTPAERAVAADLLGKAADQFGNAGCNDYPLPDTPENRQLLADVWRWADGEERAREFLDRPQGDTLYGYDWMILGYLAAKLLEEI